MSPALTALPALTTPEVAPIVVFQRAQSVAELYQASYARLVGVLTLAAGSRTEAEECVQEAFVRLLREWPRVGEYEDPEAWVRMVAFRQLSNRFRKVRNGLRAALRHGSDPDVAAPSSDRVDTHRALAQLPLGQRQAVVLHYLCGLDLNQVSETLGVAPGTIKSRLSRARATLAPLLSVQDLTEEGFHV